MLRGLWFFVCALLIMGPALLVVGTMISIRWIRRATDTQDGVVPSLVLLTVALFPDFIMLVNFFTGFRIIHVVPNSDNVPLFSEWQIISGILIILAICFSLFEGEGVKKGSLRGSLILLLIHGVGTLLFFSDTIFSWFT